MVMMNIYEEQITSASNWLGNYLNFDVFLEN